MIDTLEYDYPTFHLSMDCFWAKIVAGNLELIEAAAAKWLTKETLDSEHSRFTFDELINEMIADAWYMVTEYHLRLGPIGITDNLEEVVKYIFETYKFPSSEKREKIISFLETIEDKKIRKYKADLTLNVPYRLQVPFYDAISINRSMWSGPKQELTDEINRQKRLMYYFLLIRGLGTVIEVDGLWAEYLNKHK